MLSCMLSEILDNLETGNIEPFSQNKAVFFVKFPCALALHLEIYPEIAKGLNLMKFANNEKK